MQDRTGAGSLILDLKKQYAIRHWLEATCEAAKAEVEISLRDSPFQFGPWGETLSIMKVLFLNSTVNLLCLPDSSMVPASGEPSVALDWSLVMTPVSQEILFARIRLHYEKATAIIESPSDRRKYRLSEDELLNLRNVVTLYASIRDFLKARLRNFEEYDKLMRTTSIKDEDFRDVMESRPSRFSMSMLASAQREALEDARAQEEGATLEAEKERLKLRDTRWEYFKAALERDQKALKHVKEAPTKVVAALKHRKEVAWRLSQAELGEKVVNSYMEKFLKCDIVMKVELAQQKINEYRAFVVTWQMMRLWSWSVWCPSVFKMHSPSESNEMQNEHLKQTDYEQS